MSIQIPSPAQLKAHPDQLPEAVEKSLALARQGDNLRAFVTLFDERAPQKAIEISEKLKQGKDLPLAGWIIAVKDNIAFKDQPLTCCSRILKGFRSPYTATAVERLETAGAIVIGKTNNDEFAMGSSTENSCFGPSRNPHDSTRVAGGSSGGSAVAVAAGWVHGALGSETGGSVRQPAAFCGVVGLKPTYGRISRYGLVAFGSSLDQISPFAKSCAGVYDLLCVMAGADEADATSVREVVPKNNSGLPSLERPLRIGIPKEYFAEGLNAEVADATQKTIEALAKKGHSIVDVTLPHTKYAIPVYYIVATAEASSNLARFDGIRYGLRNNAMVDLSDVYLKSRGEGFGPEVTRRIMMGTYVLSAGYYDAYYRKAQQVRRKIFDDFLTAFQFADILITPTAPTTAFRIGEKIDDPLAMYLSDIYTVSANLAGIPAVSVPVGLDTNKLPIGAQILGPHFSEELILQSGAQIVDLTGTSI
jgi:aspartyl-tRNA(Asn)/glutamyl-tRNA(Gln) amidotransferase subunit A